MVAREPLGLDVGNFAFKCGGSWGFSKVDCHGIGVFVFLSLYPYPYLYPFLILDFVRLCSASNEDRQTLGKEGDGDVEVHCII